MPRRLALLPAIAVAALALPACAKDKQEYPSLSIRDAERVKGSFEPAPANPFVPTPPPSETLGQVARLRADAQAAHTHFLAVADQIRAAAAGRNAEVGSDSWATAQVALAGLATARSATMAPLAELDTLYVSAQNDGEDVSELEQARSEIGGWIAAENKIVDSF
ncbi:MAG: hypothetical protein J7496_02675 [Novosphingobium sp.]|nr:hypothetical protein [Novosphingobium sp.]MBO9601393.1 hypothetical protein [Novosphingobium sp.]